MSHKVILTYPERCVGCRRCEIACSIHFVNKVQPSISRIRILNFTEGLIDIPLICQQCEVNDPPCWKVCPKNCFSRDKYTNAVIINTENCTGCGKCVNACPISAIFLHTENHKVYKCELCITKDSSVPPCVKGCPSNALEYGSSPFDASEESAPEEVALSLSKKLIGGLK